MLKRKKVNGTHLLLPLKPMPKTESQLKLHPKFSETTPSYVEFILDNLLRFSWSVKLNAR